MPHLRPWIARARGRFAFWALAGVALLASHDAIYLIQVGPGQELAGALRQAGHGYWTAASVTLALLGIVAATAGILRIRRLRRAARDLGATPATGARPFGTRSLGAWASLLAIVAIGFTVQENVEHLISHGHVMGLGALLGPEFPLALPVIACITAVAGLGAALLGHAEQALLVAIAAALHGVLGRAPRATHRPPIRTTDASASPMAHAWAGRAPPRVLVSAT